MRFSCKLLIIITLSFWGCRPDVGLVEVSGQLSSAARGEVSLRLLRDGEPLVVAEERVGVNGHFLLRCSIDECELAELHFSNGQSPISLVLNPSDRLELTWERGECLVRGSYEIAQFHNIEKRLAALHSELAALHQAITDSISAPERDKLQQRADTLVRRAQEIALSYIQRNPCTLTAMLLLNAQIDASTRLIGYRQYRDVYQKVARCLSEVYPNRHDVEAFAITVQRLELRYSATFSGATPQIGSVLPLLRIPLLDSTELSIPGGRGRITLLDVEARWGQPGVGGVDYSAMYERFARRGLNLVQVLSVIEGSRHPADTVRWTRTVITNPARYAFVAQLGIDRMPCNFVIDSRGRLLAKDVYGIELEQLLERHLGASQPVRVAKPIDTLRRVVETPMPIAPPVPTVQPKVEV